MFLVKIIHCDKLDSTSKKLSYVMKSRKVTVVKPLILIIYSVSANVLSNEAALLVVDN